MGNVDQAFWIKGRKIIPVGKIHIDYIIENPELFGLTDEYIKSIYKKNKEKLGQEGKSREFLIKEVSKEGWIRVRHYTRPRDMWSIQTDDIERRKKAIDNFILFCLSEKIMTYNDELFLMSYHTDTSYSYSYMDGGVKSYLKEKVELNNKLFESNINRLLNHNEKHDCAIITAFRETRNYKENIKLNQELLAILVTSGYNVTKVQGTYVQNYETPKAIEVNEHSFYVVDVADSGTLEKDVFFLGEKFDQESISFLPKGEKKMILIGTNKDTKDDPDAFVKYKERKILPIRKLGKYNIFMTRIRKRPFFFEDIKEMKPIRSSNEMIAAMSFVDKKLFKEFINNRNN
jgi:predicted SprT family Zn-dependent metalloprotease